MDPATAFSIACGVVDLVQFGIEIGKECYEIYTSPTALTAKHETLAQSADELQHLSARVQNRLQDVSGTQTFTDEDQRLVNSANASATAAAELHDLLARLKPGKERSKRHAFGFAVKGRWERSKVEEATQKLRVCQATVDTALLARLSDRIDFSNSRQSEVVRGLDLSVLQQRCGFQDLSLQIQVIMARLDHAAAENARDGAATRTLLQQLQLEDIDQRRLDQLLESLYFPAIHSREESIEEAFQDTFQWVFDPSETATRPWHNFVDWLRESNGLYWVNGKAGSGKSTLMSYMLSKPQLREDLQTWKPEKDSELTVLYHFFWRNGTFEQRSKSGLLRTLMRQLITIRPTLVSALQLGTDGTIPPWTEARLVRSFEALVSRANDIEKPLKIAVFIDGLDEFEGSHASQAELSHFAKGLCGHQHVKLCVSSRPEQAYQDCFQGFPQLRLQDLTREDLQRYVHGQLSRWPHYQKLHKKDAVSMDQLIESICRDADGVFLWARLITEDLSNGLVCGDSIQMLQARLQRSEKTLDGLFRQFLERIDSVHRPKSAKYLQVMTQKSESQASLLEFLLVDQTDLITMLPSTGDNQEDGPNSISVRADAFLEALSELKRHLVTRCAGLLTVDENPCPHCLDRASGYDFDAICRHYDNHTKVGFIHRSAHDFLADNVAARNFVEAAESDANSVCLRIAKALVEISHRPAFVEMDMRNGNWEEWAKQMLFRVESAIKMCKECELSVQSALIDRVNVTMSESLAFWKYHHPDDVVYGDDMTIGWVELVYARLSGDAPCDITGWAMAGDFQDYAMHKLRQCPEDRRRSMANYLLSCVRLSGTFQWTREDKMLDCLAELFESGADPNAWCGVGYTKLTCWQYWLTKMANTLKPRDMYGAHDTDMSPSSQGDRMRRAVKAYLDAGADPTAVWTFALELQDPVTSLDLDIFVLFYVYEAGWAIHQLDQGAEEGQCLQKTYPVSQTAMYPLVKAIGTKGAGGFRHLEDLDRAPGIYQDHESFTPTSEQSVMLGKLMQEWQDASPDLRKEAEARKALMGGLESVYASLLVQTGYTHPSDA